MHQGYLLFHRKPPPKFEIEALFRLVMLYTDTKTKNKNIIVKSIHSSLRSKSKTKQKRILQIYLQRSSCSRSRHLHIVHPLRAKIRCEYNLDLNPINSVIIFPFNSSLNLSKTFLLTKGDTSEIPITSKLFRLLTHLKSPVEIAISSFCIQLKNSLATFGPEYSTGEISFVLLTNFGTSVVFTGNSIPFNSLSKSFLKGIYLVTLCACFLTGCKAEINDRPDRDSNPGPLD
ncbi:hypothetical protein AGLY_017101 [Aphis glycines]|uniref:Uncharacterized protein n=1 Tax=Aphis glycines TaxID=307491 RepID=A0A6G0SWH5_APHGL|nr:hypothetical protein AGLY_017101 [Aphis glycines]